MSGFRSVVAYAPESISTFGLGVAGKVFADRSHLGLPTFDFTVCTEVPGQVRTDLGLTQSVPFGLDRLTRAELVLLLPGDENRSGLSPTAIAAIRAAHDRGAIVAAFCTGTFLLAATGLLDGSRAATHWRLAADFSARHPAVITVPEVLYVDEGRIVTGAGAAAGIDMCLYLVRREHGSAVANAIAREVVVAPHRDGGQAQYIASPVPADGDDTQITAVMERARTDLGQPPSVNDLAGWAMMSPRTFARRFKAATGTTPHSWLLTQRLDHAEELLETTDLDIEEIARRVGYRTATVLREQFVKRRGIPPRAYRRTFTRQ